MREIGITAAKKTWGALLDLIEKGEQVAVTRRGKRIARLVPDQSRGDQEHAASAKSSLRK